MLIIDGSHGEGGGQLVRSAVALSVIFNKPIKINNIRAGRTNKGLKAQHLHAIKALQELTNAEVKGLKLGSSELSFKPREWTKEEVKINIPTAGSIGLIIQCLLPTLITAPHNIKVLFNGGATCGKWSPPVDFIKKVLIPNLKLFGIKEPAINVTIEGYYPKGGAIVEMITKPSKIKPVNITDKGFIKSIKGISHASISLKKSMVAERQARAVNADVKIIYSDSLSTGSSITLWAECDKTIIGADALGERGKRAEVVGSEALNKLNEELKNGAFDSHTTDMLIPFITVAGSGLITTNKITSHTLTNIWLCEQFINKKFRVKDNTIKL